MGQVMSWLAIGLALLAALAIIAIGAQYVASPRVYALLLAFARVYARGLRRCGAPTRLRGLGGRPHRPVLAEDRLWPERRLTTPQAGPTYPG